MKIVSNQPVTWSIEGLTLEPNKVIDLPIDLEDKVAKFIQLGLISIVDVEREDKVDTVKKVEAAPKQGPIIEKRVSLNNPTQAIYIEKQDNLSITVEGDVEPKMSTAINPSNSEEQPKIVAEQQDEVVTIGDVNTMSDTGSVILPSKEFGKAKLVSTAEFLEEKTNDIKQVISSAAEELASLKKEEPIKPSEIPERTQKVLSEEANKRKLFIAQLSDTEFLLEIAKCTNDKNIQSIINQRLEELK